MNISSLRKNENNILVDEVGNKVFQNQVFDQLMAYEHMSMTTPASQYVDAQANQVFFQNPEDTRRYVAAAFEMLYTKREERPIKKNGTV